MTPELWRAKKIVDSTLHPGKGFRSNPLHLNPLSLRSSLTTPELKDPADPRSPDTGQPVLLPFRMSAFVLTNLAVTAGMLTPSLTTTGTLLWQITNQSLNVAINSANANKSTPLSTSTLAQSYALAVSASCSVALGLSALVPRLKRLSPGARTVLGRLVPFAAVASAGTLNVFLMRGEEIRRGIDVFPAIGQEEREAAEAQGGEVRAVSAGRSKRAATLAVGETAVSRVLNATPIMVLPPLVLVRLQRTEWLRRRPRLTLPVNLGRWGEG